MSVVYEAPPRAIHYLENIDKKAAMAVTEPVKIATEVFDTVYLGKIDGTANQVVVMLDQKCKAITLNSCKKVAVVCSDVVARIEIVNCQKIQLQITGTCPIIQIDKTDQTTVYLSQACMQLDPTTMIYSSGCTGVNICSPTADDEDQVENAVPEQMKSQVINGKLVSEIVSGDH